MALGSGGVKAERWAEGRVGGWVDTKVGVGSGGVGGGVGGGGSGQGMGVVGMGGMVWRGEGRRWA